MVKILTYIIVVCFLTENTIWAQGQIGPQSIVHSPQFLSHNLDIPSGLGKVTDSFQGKSRKTIINIVDTHSNYEVQKNYAEIIENLFKQILQDMPITHPSPDVTSGEGVRSTGEGAQVLLAIEGACGRMDPSLFRDIENKIVRDILSDHFLSRGYINGAEYFSIYNTSEDYLFWGIDDRELYLKNKGLYDKAYEQREEIQEKIRHQISKIKNELKNQNEKSEAVPSGAVPNFSEFPDAMEKYHSQSQDVIGYCILLNQLITQLPNHFQGYPNMALMCEIIEKGKTISYNRMQKEREDLLTELKGRLVKEDLENLIRKSIQFKAERISSLEYYTYLMSLHGTAEALSVENLHTYTNLLQMYKNLDHKKLLKEIMECEIEIIGQDNRLKQLYELLILNKLARLELTKNEWEYYKDWRAQKQKQKTPSCLCPFLPFRLLNTLESYYETVADRDEVMLANTLAKMDEENIKTAILVTGGFHTEGMTEKMRQKGINYIVINPNGGATQDNAAYPDVMLHRLNPLEKLITQHGTRLAVAANLAEKGLDLANKKQLEDMWRFLAELLESFFESINLKDMKEINIPEDKDLIASVAHNRGNFSLIMTQKNAPEFVKAYRYADIKESIRLKDNKGWIFICGGTGIAEQEDLAGKFINVLHNQELREKVREILDTIVEKYGRDNFKRRLWKHPGKRNRLMKVLRSNNLFSANELTLPDDINDFAKKPVESLVRGQRQEKRTDAVEALGMQDKANEERRRIPDYEEAKRSKRPGGEALISVTTKRRKKSFNFGQGETARVLQDAYGAVYIKICKLLRGPYFDRFITQLQQSIESIEGKRLKIFITNPGALNGAQSARYGDSIAIDGNFWDAIKKLIEMRSGLTSWTLQNLGKRRYMRWAAAPIMPVIKWMCSRFILPVDVNVEDEDRFENEMGKIVGFIKDKKEKGMAVTLDNVGDAALSEEDARGYAEYYKRVIHYLAEIDEVNEINLSLKFSALVYNFDAVKYYKDLTAMDEDSRAASAKVREIKQRMLEILKAAHSVKGKKTFIRIDFEEYEYRNATLEIFKELVDESITYSMDTGLVKIDDAGNLRLGIVIQAYLRDSEAVLEDLYNWAEESNYRIPVRLVKGAYDKKEKELAYIRGDYKSPVFTHKQSTDANFEKLSELLICGRQHFQPAFGTHYIGSIAKVMALAENYGMQKDEFEFQMLEGMGAEIQEIIVKMGYKMRVYLPAGTLDRGMGSAGRRFRELASEDNALTRTLKGLYSAEAMTKPEFHEEDVPKPGAISKNMSQGEISDVLAYIDRLPAEKRIDYKEGYTEYQLFNWDSYKLAVMRKLKTAGYDPIQIERFLEGEVYAADTGKPMLYFGYGESEGVKKDIWDIVDVRNNRVILSKQKIDEMITSQNINGVFAYLSHGLLELALRRDSGNDVETAHKQAREAELWFVNESARGPDTVGERSILQDDFKETRNRYAETLRAEARRLASNVFAKRCIFEYVKQRIPSEGSAGGTAGNEEVNRLINSQPLAVLNLMIADGIITSENITAELGDGLDGQGINALTGYVKEMERKFKLTEDLDITAGEIMFMASGTRFEGIIGERGISAVIPNIKSNGKIADSVSGKIIQPAKTVKLRGMAMDYRMLYKFGTDGSVKLQEGAAGVISDLTNLSMQSQTSIIPFLLALDLNREKLAKLREVTPYAVVIGTDNIGGDIPEGRIYSAIAGAIKKECPALEEKDIDLLILDSEQHELTREYIAKAHNLMRAAINCIDKSGFIPENIMHELTTKYSEMIFGSLGGFVNLEDKASEDHRAVSDSLIKT